MKPISVDRAAQMVGVSAATLRNWAKAGHIVAVKTTPLSFSEMDVFGLKNQLSAGTLQKLKTRANKARSEASTLPSEYASNDALIDHIKAIVERVRHQKLDIECVLLMQRLEDLVSEFAPFESMPRQLLDKIYLAYQRQKTS